MIDVQELRITYAIIQSKHPLLVIPTQGLEANTQEDVESIVKSCASFSVGEPVYAYKSDIPLILVKANTIKPNTTIFYHKGSVVPLIDLDLYLCNLSEYAQETQAKVKEYIDWFFDEFTRNR